MHRLLLVLTMMFVAAFARGDEFTRDVRETAESLLAVESRLPGTPGHAASMQRLDDMLSSIDGATIYRDSFQAVVPVTKEAYVEIDGARHDIYPMWPALARLNTTPAEGITAPLVYVGEADHVEIPPKRLHGSIAVMEYSAGRKWVNAAAHGARAILLLGGPDDSVYHAEAHVLWHPVNMPRYYVPEGELADRLRAGAGEARVFCSAEWRRTEATNRYVLIQGTEPGDDPRALAVSVQADGMSMTPDLAQGADAGVDAAFGVSLVRELAADPPARSVLVAFIDAYGMYHHGTREFLATLHVTADEREDFLRDEREFLEDYTAARDLALELQNEPDPLAVLHRDEYDDLHTYVKDAINTRLAELDTRLEPRRVELFLAEGEEKERLQDEVDALAEERQSMLGANRQMLTTREISEESRERVQAFWEACLERLDRQVAEVGGLIAREEGRDALRTQIAAALGMENPESAKPLGFLLGVDLSDSGEVVGPQLSGRMFMLKNIANSRDFADWIRKVDDEEREQVWPGDMRNAVNLRPVTTSDDYESYQMGQIATTTSPAIPFGLAAVSWSTLNGYRIKVDTPRDRAENLDWSRLDPQILATRGLIQRFANETNFPWPEARLLPRWRRISGSIVDQAPGEPLARLPMGGYLATFITGTAGGGQARPHSFWGDTAGMRRQQFGFTRTDGRYTNDYFPGYLFDQGNWDFRNHYIQAFDFAEDGSIVRAVDLQRSGRGVTLVVDVLAARPTHLRARVFTCGEFSAFGLYDPRFLNPIPDARIIDARRNSPPRRMNFSIDKAILNLLLEPKSAAQVLGKVGTSNRLALLNMGEPRISGGDAIRSAMQGFSIDEPLPAHPWAVAARDFYELNGLRVESFRSAGITSEPVDALRDRTGELLDEADAAYEANDGAAYFEAISAAVANELRAYSAVRSMANDVAYGAIFLLLVLVPFSWAMERLIFATPYIYRQIGYSIGIFVLMAGVLWAFHPAFRISGQPLIVILAFIIILMSLVVMTMVYSRFERELEEMRSGRAEGAGAKTSTGGLVMTALRLGIANMRKRKLRTVLTATTVILITFTLLCFTSTSAYLGQKDNILEAKSSYTGILVRQPSVRRIQEPVVDYVQELAGDRATAVRAWWFSPWSGTWRIYVRNPETGGRIALPAALGLSAQEDEVTGIDRILPRWDEFAQGNGTYLADNLAKELGVEAGDTVVVGGRDLELLAVFDADEFDREVVDLDQQPLRPFDYHQLGYQERLELITGDWSTALLESEIESGQGLEPLRKIPQTGSERLVILPYPLVRGEMGNPFTVRSIAVKTETPEEAKELAGELVKRLAIPIYYGEPDGVHIVASTPLLPQAPKSLVIPLAIAGLIVFNTMLSSIAERKKEIYIYTSLGLAPLHIAMLFLAEAITYGLMGSVFGYVMGQWLATGLSSLGWLGGITLNYSGTQAIVTMSLVLAVIVVAALVPAFLAGRLAAPSNRMKWDVPAPDGDKIRDVLPFTVTHSTVGAMMTFMLDYMEVHSEGAIGAFTTDSARIVIGEDGKAELHGVVWLAPYDLGVRQEFRLHSVPTEDDEVLGLEIELTRGSGPTNSWRKLNRVFLGGLRRQMLGWRKQKPERILEYILAAKEGRAGVA